MIVITVENLNGEATEALSAAFDELGGTIGRAPTNQLVLPDPERSVSRVHARIVYRNGGYAVVDHGSNPVIVNGQPLGNGREMPIRESDTLQIGGYLLTVSRGRKTAGADPFADLFAAPPPAAPAPRAPAPRAPAQPMAAPPPSWPAAAPAPAAPPAGIPDDWNPFAPEAPRPPAPAPQAGNPYIPDLPLAASTREQSIDTLFDLTGGDTAADPWARTPAAAVPAQPNMAGADDPLQALLGSAPPVAAPMADHVSELNTPWSAPALSPAPVAAPPVSPPGAVLSWDQPSRAGQVVMPSVPHAGLAPPPAVPPATATAAAPAATAPGGPAAPAQALARAFAEGLGVPELGLDTLDEARMRLIGQLLAEATRGAVQLLQARAALKREMRAEVTMIVARENNPLKFSPAVEVALRHLLGPPTRGFLAPADAMRDAFDDLRAHQLGVMAGMRSALEGVLERFDPAVLEGKLSRRSSLADLIPASRKARLWELFQELYVQLSKEAADDFEELFGKAFRRAYEAHIDQLQRKD